MATAMFVTVIFHEKNTKKLKILCNGCKLYINISIKQICYRIFFMENQKAMTAEQEYVDSLEKKAKVKYLVKPAAPAAPVAAPAAK